jgi:hypothetical protein
MNPRVSKSLAALGVAMTLGACASPQAMTAMGDGRFSGIHSGLTQDEVRRVVGDPGSVSSAPDSGETHWIYTFVDTWGQRAVYDVAFDAGGHVERTSSLRVGF